MIDVLGDSLCLPCEHEGPRLSSSESTWPQFLQASTNAPIRTHAVRSATSRDLARQWTAAARQVPPPSVTIIQVGIVDACPRPYPRSLNRLIRMWPERFSQQESASIRTEAPSYTGCGDARGSRLRISRGTCAQCAGRPFARIAEYSSSISFLRAPVSRRSLAPLGPMGTTSHLGVSRRPYPESARLVSGRSRCIQMGITYCLSPTHRSFEHLRRN